jgi:hypothetical protein
MRHATAFEIGVLIAGGCLVLQGQNAPTEIRGLPPRATPADYQAHASAGKVTVAAEFARHSVPTMEGTYSTPDYVVVETGLFGPRGEHLTISIDNFSLRVNGKKTPLPSQPFGLLFSSLKDPEWAPPVPPESKSRTGLTSGGPSGLNDTKPTPPKMPLALRRVMNQHVQKASLPEGDRALPVAGLIYFEYRGKADGIHSLELIYDGPAGKATMPLLP